jgi:hypothetical protein
VERPPDGHRMMTIAGRTTLTSTNADPSSSSGGTALPPCPHNDQALEPQNGLTSVRESLRSFRW